MNRRNLTQRVLFAAVAAPIGWLLVNFNRSIVPSGLAQQFFGVPTADIFPGQILAVILVFLACFEYLRMLSTLFPRNGFWLVYIWLALQAVSNLLPEGAPGIIDALARYELFGPLILVIVEAAIWGRRSIRWQRASLLFIGIAFLYYATVSLLAYYREPLQVVFPPFENPLVGELGIVTVLASVFFCDTAAYFVGNFWGRHHFTSISPNKTVEGAVAGLATSVAFSVVGWWFFAAPRFPVYLGVLLGLLIGVAGQAGDLLVSLMKRYFKVKDASDLIPGHGGVLDRFDSMFFTAPVVHLFLIAVVRIFSQGA